MIIELDLVFPELDCVVVYLLAERARVGNQTVLQPDAGFQAPSRTSRAGAG
jgi:hypothetical protein